MTLIRFSGEPPTPNFSQMKPYDMTGTPFTPEDRQRATTEVLAQLTAAKDTLQKLEDEDPIARGIQGLRFGFTPPHLPEVHTVSGVPVRFEWPPFMTEVYRDQFLSAMKRLPYPGIYRALKENGWSILLQPLTYKECDRFFDHEIETQHKQIVLFPRAFNEETPVIASMASGDLIMALASAVNVGALQKEVPPQMRFGLFGKSRLLSNAPEFQKLAKATGFADARFWRPWLHGVFGHQEWHQLRYPHEPTGADYFQTLARECLALSDEESKTYGQSTILTSWDSQNPKHDPARNYIKALLAPYKE